jgi:nucleotide-binding universal stress UspA family protein
MVKKILVAVSAGSADTVLPSAIEVARKHDAQIVALHVVDPTTCYIGATDYNFGLILEALQTNGREFVEQISGVLDDHGRSAETRMVTLPMAGLTTGRAIAAVAAETGADLILLGKRKSPWWGWFREDVAREVTRFSSTPIQIVAGKAPAAPAPRVGKRWAAAADAR